MEQQKIDVAGLARNREKTIIRTSVIGIIANLFLSAFKAAVGLISNSIAVVLDAVNNLSDALSSVITIIGTKLAGRLPDKKHPMGHGRIEYLSSMVVAALVLYAGLTSLIESVKKIIHPEEADYSTETLIILAVAVVVKLALGRYVKKQGQRVNSGALVASGSDAAFDAILSASVLASAILFLTTGISLEAYVGVFIAVMIIKAGYEMMGETLNEILGHRADAEITQEIKRILAAEEHVRGAYDLIVYNYGPDRNYASVHIEVPDTMKVEEVDRLSRQAETKVFQQTGVILTAIGVYAYNTGDTEAVRIRNRVQEIVLSHEWALQYHGFYVNTQEKLMRLDVVFSFDIEAKEGLRIITEEIQQAFPDYTLQITPDVDLSD